MDIKKDKDGRGIITAMLQVIEKIDEPKCNGFRPVRSIDHPNIQRLATNDENSSCVPDADATVTNELRERLTIDYEHDRKRLLSPIKLAVDPSWTCDHC